MAVAKSAIEWTDATWNPVTGCSKVSPGCKNCYAERLAPRVFAGQILQEDTTVPAGRSRKFTDVICHDERLDAPLRWKKPRRIFVNSMSDLFHEDVPDAFIDRVFAVMALTPRHTYQVLTKRPERMRDYLTRPFATVGIVQNILRVAGDVDGRPEGGLLQEAFILEELWKSGKAWPLPNVWLGTSVENQRFAEERIPLLLQTPAVVTFISVEPLLGRVDLRNLNTAPELHLDALSGIEVMGEAPAQGPKLDWVIVGGESGPGARPFDVEWARAIVQQCRAAGVPVFVKQLGANPETAQGCGDCDPCLAGQRCHQSYNIRLMLRDRKGGDPSEWPAVLRVREWPRC